MLRSSLGFARLERLNFLFRMANLLARVGHQVYLEPYLFNNHTLYPNMFAAAIHKYHKPRTSVEQYDK